MVDLNQANIPSSINTVEKLYVWAAAILTEVHGGETYGEIPPSPSDTGIRKIALGESFVDDRGQRRWLSRVSVPLSAEALSGTLPMWDYALVMKSGAAPSSYLEV